MVVPADDPSEPCYEAETERQENADLPRSCSLGRKRGAEQRWQAGMDCLTRRLYSLDAGKDWLVVTPDGLFDGSEGAWKFVTYREPGTLKLIDATRRRFHSFGFPYPPEQQLPNGVNLTPGSRLLTPSYLYPGTISVNGQTYACTIVSKPTTVARMMLCQMTALKMSASLPS